jgi:hypothetical protein
VADLDEAGKQDMEQEVADELDRIEVHDLDAVVMFGVAPAKTHLAIDQAQQASVGVAGRYFSTCSGPPKAAWHKRSIPFDAADVFSE